MLINAPPTNISLSQLHFSMSVSTAAVDIFIQCKQQTLRETSFSSSSFPLLRSSNCFHRLPPRLICQSTAALSQALSPTTDTAEEGNYMPEDRRVDTLTHWGQGEWLGCKLLDGFLQPDRQFPPRCPWEESGPGCKQLSQERVSDLKALKRFLVLCRTSVDLGKSLSM